MLDLSDKNNLKFSKIYHQGECIGEQELVLSENPVGTYISLGVTHLGVLSSKHFFSIIGPIERSRVERKFLFWQKVKPIQCLSQLEIRIIEQCLVAVTYKMGDVIYSENETNPIYVYLIIAGTVAAFKTLFGSEQQVFYSS